MFLAYEKNAKMVVTVVTALNKWRGNAGWACHHLRESGGYKVVTGGDGKEIFMTSDEIFNLAKNKTPPPDGMSLPEQMLFTVARGIYRAYSAKEITREQARREKLNAIREFDRMSLGERCYKDQVAITLELSPLSVEAEKHGCDICRKMARLLDRRLLPRIREGTLND